MLAARSIRLIPGFCELFTFYALTRVSLSGKLIYFCCFVRRAIPDLNRSSLRPPCFLVSDMNTARMVSLIVCMNLRGFVCTMRILYKNSPLVVDLKHLESK